MKYVVDKIVDHKVTRDDVQLLVKWEGYRIQTWELLSEIYKDLKSLI